jgi:hypothetical protein
LSGTWRVMGRVGTGNTNKATLFIRIS